MPEEPMKLTIGNVQPSSNRDIGMNTRHMHHVNTCILWLRTFIKGIIEYILKTLLHC
jgi:hypothetical protein